MTKEESIKVLTQYIDYDAETPDYYEMEKACKVALKVLKQEPCEDCRTCNKWSECECGEKGHKNGTSIGYSIGECKDYEPCDCISRAEAIEALGYDISIESDEGLDAYRTVIKEMLCKIYDAQKENIEKLPSVQPKPKTDVLDKIRAEIKEESKFCPFTEGLERALEIIDKYKAESEG